MNKIKMRAAGMGFAVALLAVLMLMPVARATEGEFILISPVVVFANAPYPVIAIPYDTGITIEWSWGPENGCQLDATWPDGGVRIRDSGPDPLGTGSWTSPPLTTQITIVASSCIGGRGDQSGNSGIQIAIASSSATTGIVSVTSQNTVTGEPTPGVWTFPSYPSIDPCTSAGGICSGTFEQYLAMPTGLYDIQPSAAPANFVFHSLATSTPASQTLLANGDANFALLWDPLARMTVNTSPSPLSFNIQAGSSTSGQMTIANNGGPGSTLDWNATSSAPSWLAVSQPSGCLDAGNAAYNGCTDTMGAQTINVSVNAIGLATGTYTGTITFTGTSFPTDSILNSDSITVTLNVGSSGSSSTPPTITIITPQPTAAGVPVQMIASGGAGSGTYTWTTSNSTPSGANTDTFEPTYSLPGNYLVTLTSGGQSTSTTLVITGDCTFTASPTTIIPPQRSTLSWGCAPGTAQPNSAQIRDITDNTMVGIGLPVSSSVAVAPMHNTEYQLLVGANGEPSFNIPTTPVVITVQGPGVIEINPGGSSTAP